MFQKWLIAFLADRGWRYLRNRRARKQLHRTVQKRARQQIKQAQRRRARGGARPGRALTLLALGAGAYAYYRSRQQTAWNDQFTTPPRTSSNPTNLTSSAAATAVTPVTASTPEPNVMAPFYNAGPEHVAPATLGDTAMLVEVDESALPAMEANVDPLAPQADAPTDAPQTLPEQSDTLAVPAANAEDDTGHTAVAPTYQAQASSDPSTLAMPAANPEDDAAEAIAPTYEAQASLAESTLDIPAANPEDDVAADADALNEEAATKNKQQS